MSYNIEIRPLAAKEIFAAYDRYESRKEGLGKRFLETLDVFFEALLRDPVIHCYYEAPVRQGSLHGFPYVVLYEVIGEQIVVYSLLMTDQYPEKKRTG